jgi:chitosanase
MITSQHKSKILSITSVFEGGNCNAKYDLIATLPDGPDGRVQLTYGKHQTTEYGNLRLLLLDYVKAGGKYATLLKPYVNSIGVRPLLKWDSKSEKYVFVQKEVETALKSAGSDPIMCQVQDAFFDKVYWNPAYNFFSANQFTLPLSMAVIYDSYIHSGCVPMWLRDDFAEPTPLNGGGEKAWITQYVNARDLWLEHNPKPILRNTDYRTDCWIECIEKENWDLSQPVVCKFNSVNPHNWITIT